MASAVAPTIITSFVFFLFSFSLQLTQLLAITLPPGAHIPAIFGFGDSIIDPGNNNYITTVVKCDFSPYGRDFKGGQPTGRFSNGKIPTDMIASALRIKDLLPPYLDPSLKPEDLLTGVSFASGGAGYDPLTAKLVSVLGLSDQIELFKEYLGKVKAIAGEEKVQSILSESIFFIVAGSDDIANTYFTTPFRKPKYDVPAYTDLMIQGASTFIQELYGLGARRIGVFSAPPIGCVPAQRTLGGGKQRDCAEAYNQAAQLFNSKLFSLLNNFNSKFPQMKAVYIDIYNPLNSIIQKPANKGFQEATLGCCGTGKIEVVVLCNDLDAAFTCDDANKYVFWDGYHPTERTYQTLLTPLVNKYIPFFF